MKRTFDLWFSRDSDHSSMQGEKYIEAWSEQPSRQSSDERIGSVIWDVRGTNNSHLLLGVCAAGFKEMTGQEIMPGQCFKAKVTLEFEENAIQG